MTTKFEQFHLDAIHEMQCCVASEDCSPGTQAHHVTRGGKRIDHFHTLPLCENHHSPQSPLPLGEAVHKGKKLFEKKYGSQFELLKRVRSECPCPTCVNLTRESTGE